MATAFLPINTNLPLANLESDFARVMILLGDARPPIWDTAGLMNAYKEALKGQQFDPACDYLVQTGRTIYVVMMMLAVWEYMAENFPDDSGVTVLIYDATSNRYRDVRIRYAYHVRPVVQQGDDLCCGD
jgi:hypothetical protein